MSQFNQDVADWVWEHTDYPGHRAHSPSNATLSWDHTDGYDYSTMTSESSCDDVVVVADCDCGESVTRKYTFYSTGLAQFLNEVSQTK